MARTELIESIWEHRSHQRCVADRQSGAGRLDPYYLFIVFLYPHDQTRLAKEREVMRKRCVVSSVLKLSKHFLIGQNLAGIRTGQRKELTKKSWRRLIAAPDSWSRVSAPCALTSHKYPVAPLLFADRRRSRRSAFGRRASLRTRRKRTPASQAKRRYYRSSCVPLTIGADEATTIRNCEEASPTSSSKVIGSPVPGRDSFAVNVLRSSVALVNAV